MKKVLILAYDFPPYVSVGGLRPYSWYKYFKEFGLYPIVVTRQWENKYGNYIDYIAPGESDETIIEETEYGTVIRTPYKPNLANRLLLKYGEKKFRIIRKIITAYFELMQFVFFVGPKSGLYRAAKNYLQKHKVDIIIATGEPFVLFKYASKLSSKYKIPWIADYRDPWSQSPERNKNLIIKKINVFFEKRILKNVRAVVTVSDFCKLLISKYVSSKSFHIIPNGFDEEIISKISNITQQNEILKIAYIGTIYKWHPIDSFLYTLNRFINMTTKPNIMLVFWGINIENHINNLINTKYPALKNYVKIEPKTKYDELMSKLASFNVLLLFNYYANIGTKIYDYLALKRHILFCFSEETANEKVAIPYEKMIFKDISLHPQIDLIETTNAGTIIKNSNHLLEELINLHQEFENNKYIKCNTKDISIFSRKAQAEKLSNIIKQEINNCN